MLLVLVFLLDFSSRSTALYEGDQLFRVRVDHQEHARLLLSLRQHTHLDFWTEVGLHRNVDIRCQSEECPKLRSLLEDHQIPHFVGVEDLSTIAGLYPVSTGTNHSVSRAGHSIDWE